jgi:hypothetical protein
MRVREAKDFLVAQTAEQAALEGVPLSDLEKRMMYFTESGYVPEDPIKLNEEFEAEYESDEYEAKISRLLRHAYQRLRKENDAARKNWDDAIRCLRRGDHYLLVMWDARPGIHAPQLIGVGIAIFALALFEPQMDRQPVQSPEYAVSTSSLSCGRSRRLFLSNCTAKRSELALGKDNLSLDGTGKRRR